MPCAGTPVQNLPGPLQVTASSPLDGPTVSGSEISMVVGTRISTPFFGTGFNFCVGESIFVAAGTCCAVHPRARIGTLLGRLV